MNAADHDMDEAAERQAFMEAVAEWRRVDQESGIKAPVRIEREYLGAAGAKAPSSSSSSASSLANAGASDAGSKAEDGMWKNPFAPQSPAGSSSASTAKAQVSKLTTILEIYIYRSVIEWGLCVFYSNFKYDE